MRKQFNKRGVHGREARVTLMVVAAQQRNDKDVRGENVIGNDHRRSQLHVILIALVELGVLPVVQRSPRRCHGPAIGRGSPKDVARRQRRGSLWRCGPTELVVRLVNGDRRRRRNSAAIRRRCDPVASPDVAPRHGLAVFLGRRKQNGEKLNRRLSRK